jgi:hypothetical protein
MFSISVGMCSGDRFNASATWLTTETSRFSKLLPFLAFFHKIILENISSTNKLQLVLLHGKFTFLNQLRFISN